MVTLVIPTIKDKETVEDYIEEIKSTDNNFDGTSDYGKIDCYEEWLKKIKDNESIETCPKNLIPQSTFLLYDDNCLVGSVNIRHYVNEKTENFGGHIGYLIRPTKRNKGYGTQILKLALEKCKKLGIEEVIVACREDNLASMNVIKNNKGIFLNRVFNDNKGCYYCRYKIVI